jgi:Na+-transporting NADH:ubiquinone oxidoreductase subunit NqrF
MNSTNEKKIVVKVVENDRCISRLDAYLQMMAEEREVRHQEYLDKKYKWDFPDDMMSQYELLCLEVEIKAYEKEHFNT